MTIEEIEKKINALCEALHDYAIDSCFSQGSGFDGDGRAESGDDSKVKISKKELLEAIKQYKEQK